MVRKVANFLFSINRRLIEQQLEQGALLPRSELELPLIMQNNVLVATITYSVTRYLHAAQLRSSRDPISRIVLSHNRSNKKQDTNFPIK